jgi:hypothetical protein
MMKLSPAGTAELQTRTQSWVSLKSPEGATEKAIGSGILYCGLVLDGSALEIASMTKLVPSEISKSETLKLIPTGNTRPPLCHPEGQPTR